MYQEPLDWTDYAACRAADPELFFQPDAIGNARTLLAEDRRVSAAKAVCRSCPVTSQCLEYALRSRSQGLWGGMTDRERDILRARRQREAV